MASVLLRKARNRPPCGEAAPIRCGGAAQVSPATTTSYWRTGAGRPASRRILKSSVSRSLSAGANDGSRSTRSERSAAGPARPRTAISKKRRNSLSNVVTLASSARSNAISTVSARTTEPRSISVLVAFVVDTPLTVVVSRPNRSADRWVMNGTRVLAVGPTMISGRDGGESIKPSRCAALRCDATPPVTSVAARRRTASFSGAPATRNTPRCNAINRPRRMHPST